MYKFTLWRCVHLQNKQHYGTQFENLYLSPLFAVVLVALYICASTQYGHTQLNGWRRRRRKRAQIKIHTH